MLKFLYDYKKKYKGEKMSLIIPDKNMAVRKSEALLNARYQLGELALKLVSIIYSNVKRNDEVGKDYQIRVEDIAKLMNKNYGNIYIYLKNAINEMLRNPLEIEVTKENGKKVLDAFNWIADAHYENGVISFTISKRLKPYILELQQKFVKYRLENILNLRGVYVIRFYEILKNIFERETRHNKKAEKIYSLDEFREMLEIPRSYNYGGKGGIKDRILEKSKQELSENTDILFEYEEIKTGRKVTHLKFYILPNPAKLQDNYNKNDNYFKSRASFVKFLRDNYAGNGKYFGYKTIEGRNWWLGINNKGLMYATLAEEIKHLNSVESEQFYDIWFKIAKNIELYRDILINKECLEELYKENKEVYFGLVEQILLLKEQGII
jgi:plasmid replication initiation protein